MQSKVTCNSLCGVRDNMMEGRPLVAIGRKSMNFIDMADMWPSYGLLVVQIWQTGMDHPNAIILLYIVCGPEQGVRSGLDLGQN